MKRDDYCDRVKRLREQVTKGLEKSNKVKLGDGYLVRIPKIQGRINRIKRDDRTYVEYIYERGYDPETKQSRNKKVLIGTILSEYPNALLPNDNYTEFFDIDTGRPKKRLDDIGNGEKPTTDEDTPDGMKSEAERPSDTRDRKTKKAKSGKDITEEPSSRVMKPWSPEDMTEEEKRHSRELTRRAGQEIYESIVKRRTQAQEEAEKEEIRKRNLELYGEEHPDVEPLSLEEWHKILIDDIEGDYGEPGEEEENKDTGNENQNEDRKDENDMEQDSNSFNEEELRKNYEAVNAFRERVAILADILKKIHESIKTQAKKRPDDVISPFKAQKINSILSELKEKYAGTGYDDLLEMIDEPQEVEKDGRTILVGPTYSDVEVILDHYASILHFIKAKKI